MINPVLAEYGRGGIVESRHRGGYAVVDGGGRVVASAGDIGAAIYPRSAIKALQCLAVIESGAADRFGFVDEEIALCCSSHGGEPEHVRVARSMLAKAGLSESLYECGAHWPLGAEAQHDLARGGGAPLAVHNNCSGKHAGMLALSSVLGAAHRGYVAREHPVQRAGEANIGEVCGLDLSRQPCGVDGCSVPTWAMPLRNVAHGFARLASGEGLSAARKVAANRIFAACAAHPFMVAGTGRFCTGLMRAVPRAFVKTGAEGVYCAAVPHAGIGIALKCDDGATRASEVAVAALLAALDVWSDAERRALRAFASVPVKNWRGIETGSLRAIT